jgi:hypothetical protein
LRQEDKEVDGSELERAQERKRESELIEDDEEQLYDLDGTPEYDRDEQRSGVVAGAMRRILQREHLVLADLGLEQRDLRALEALKTAADGREKRDGFVYAEDRSALLEQALAVLQPELAMLVESGGDELAILVREVGALRERLEQLEEAQEEVEAQRTDEAKAEAGDTDEKPDDDTSLDGPERKIDKPKSSLSGPERKEEPKPASTLSGPERKEEPKPTSSLGGPERKEEPKPPTTLGDPKEIAAAATPWWKR